VLGTLLHQSWLAKKSISPLVSSDPVDQMYNDLQSNGMIGGKLLGSGGSGFIFGLFDSEDKRNKMANRYAHLNIDYDFDMKGSSVVNG
jgi:galactokinase/mevalonate kinase-like predicted kinase